MPRTRRQLAVVLLLPVVALALAPTGCMTPASRPRPVATVRSDDADPADTLSKLVEAHNMEREKEKLPPLVPDDRLKAAAQSHADDMAKHEKMVHTGSNGSTPFKRMEKAGYHYRRAGENIARGQRGLDELMTEWMGSEGHKNNILGKFTDIGAAYAIDENGTPYWCVTFGTPPPQ